MKNMISKVHIGDRVRFKPACFSAQKTDDGRGGQNRYEFGSEVTGTACFIHRRHRWFRVRYEIHGQTFHECFPMPVPPPDPEIDRELLSENMTQSHQGKAPKTTKPRGYVNFL